MLESSIECPSMTVLVDSFRQALELAAIAYGAFGFFGFSALFHTPPGWGDITEGSNGFFEDRSYTSFTL